MSSPLRRFLTSVREALAGNVTDFTAIPVRQAVFVLAVPMVAEMFMESLFAIMDIFWVGRLGSDAVAVVGLTESLLAIVYAVSMGFASAATALISRRTGEKDANGAATTAVQILAVGTIVSVVLGTLGVIFAPSLLALMGASKRVIALGASYTSVMFGGTLSILMLFLGNAIFRGAGDAVIAMRVLWLANGLNILLGPLFIFGLGPIPALGVTGAAIATTLGRSIGVLFQLQTLIRGRSRIAIRLSHLRFDRATMLGFLTLSGGGTLQTLIETTSWLGLATILASFGSATIAGYTIALRIVLFALLPSFGIANAGATLVGQNLGAGQPDRAESSVWTAARYNLVLLGSVTVLFVLFPEPIVSLFTQDAAAIPSGVDCLRILSLGFLFYAYGFVVVVAFNGAGDVRTPMLLNVVCFWFLKIPLAWLLAKPLGMGPRGVYIAVAVSYTCMAIAGVVIFRKGRWKKQRV